METRTAKIKRQEKSTSLILQGKEQQYEIILTDDNPSNIKSVFNGLLRELKAGLFCYKLDDSETDLFNHICTEYVTQFNAELSTVHKELTAYDLLEAKQSN